MDVVNYQAIKQVNSAIDTANTSISTIKSSLLENKTTGFAAGSITAQPGSYASCFIISSACDITGIGFNVHSAYQTEGISIRIIVDGTIYYTNINIGIFSGSLVGALSIPCFIKCNYSFSISVECITSGMSCVCNYTVSYAI